MFKLSVSEALISRNKLIYNLAKNDFKKKFKGSYFGIFWAFANPLITILLYWFVFQIGFRSGVTTSGAPFVVWLICGMIPWFFFAEAFANATLSFAEYSFLVKKVVFKISILPIVKIVSSFFIHLFFLLFLFLILIIYGIYPDIYWFQVIYYIVGMVVLLVGASFITSSIVPFFKDMNQIVSIIVQIGFWLTPIVWSLDIAPSKYQFLFKLNPFYYIAEGYRDSFLNEVWFWEKPFETMYFWIVAFAILLIGGLLYKKLKPHFADVL
ncbi:ABC transporter permease [Paenibacillus sp. FSL R5-0887]|uniref:ABC transporter permease n=1 Tax=Paenibacillus sp. FSL R5-0887 TaxID=2921662 RepID=UPI0030F51BAB